jgi:hypothetical protein
MTNEGGSEASPQGFTAVNRRGVLPKGAQAPRGGVSSSSPLAELFQRSSGNSQDMGGERRIAMSLLSPLRFGAT